MYSNTKLKRISNFAGLWRRCFNVSICPLNNSDPLKGLGITEPTVTLGSFTRICAVPKIVAQNVCYHEGTN